MPNALRLLPLVLLAAGAVTIAGANSSSPVTSPVAPPPGESTGGSAPEGLRDIGRRPEPGDRVVVRVIGRRIHPGTLELLSDDVVVIRTPKGKTASFPRSSVVDVLSLLPVNSGRVAEVRLYDGRSFEGPVISDDFDAIVLSIETVRVRLDRDQIASVRLVPTFDEQLAHYRRIVDRESAVSWMELCRWLADQRRWDLVALEVDALLDQHESYGPAVALQRVASAQALLVKPNAAEGGPAGEDGEPAAGPAEAEEPRGDAFDRRVLTPEEVNTLRVFEIDFDRPPRLAVPRETIDRLMQAHGRDPRMPTDPRDRARLKRADPADLVRLMFELRARDLYPEIRVLSEPEALLQFRRTVHDAWLVNVCGACHSGPDAGRFRLHVPSTRGVDYAMTNLLVLDRLDLPEAGPLLDWDHPIESRLFQFALPRHLARYPHPAVEGFRPAFRDVDDRVARRTLAWLQSMYVPRPKYPIDYDPGALIQRAAAEAKAAAADEAPAARNDR